MAIKDFTGLNSDYIKAVAETKDEDSNITYWENLLQPAKQQYESSIATAQKTAGYDISGAYKNYLKSQQQIMDSSLLGTSKNVLSTQAKGSYESSYATAQSDLLKSSEEAATQYAKDYSTSYSALEKEASQIQDIDKSLYEYIATNYSQYDLSEEDINKMYKFNSDSGKQELTDYGKAIYQTVFEEASTGENRFGAYLKDTSEDLYNYFIENRDRVTSSLADYKGTTDYSKNLEASRLSNAKLERNENMIATNTNLVDNKITIDNKNYVSSGVQSINAFSEKTRKDLKSLQTGDVFIGKNIAGKDIVIRKSKIGYEILKEITPSTTKTRAPSLNMIA